MLTVDGIFRILPNSVRMSTTHNWHRVIETFSVFMKKNISDDAEAIFSDEHVCYGELSNENRKHETVEHGNDDWARDGVHTNSIESVWGIV